MSARQRVADLIEESGGAATFLGVPRALVDFLGGDHRAAILLNQMLYWADKTDDSEGWFYKSYPEWETELGLSAYQVRRRVTLLTAVGVETKVHKGRLPAPTLHYRVNVEALLTALAEWLRPSTNLTVESEVSEGSSVKFIDDGTPSSLMVEGEVSEGTFITETTPEKTAPDEAETASPGVVIPVEDEEVKKARKAWEMAYSQLQLQFDAAQFRQFIEGAQFIHKNGVFEIGARNEWSRTMLQGRLYRDVRRILSDCWGEMVEIVFKTLDGAPVDADEEVPIFKLIARQQPLPPAPSLNSGRGRAKGTATGQKLTEKARKRLEAAYGADRVGEAVAILAGRSDVHSPARFVEGIIKNRG